MSLLLDTHVVLWWLVDDPRLSDATRQLVQEEEAVFVSVVSAWEVAIKAGLGRLSLPASFAEGIVGAGFQPLPITFAHCEAVASLPPIHRDPFDRMLVAQARTEGLAIVTKDSAITAYDVSIRWDS